MAEYKPSRFEVYFKSSSVLVQSMIIFTISLLILSPISTLIGVTTWIMMSVSLTTAYFFWKEHKNMSLAEGTAFSSAPNAERPSQKQVYSIKQLHEMKKFVTLDDSTSLFQYSITKIQHASSGAASSSRSTTPVSFKARDNSANSYHRVSVRSASPMIFYTSGEKRGRSCSNVASSRRGSDVFTDFDSTLPSSANVLPGPFPPSTGSTPGPLGAASSSSAPMSLSSATTTATIPSSSSSSSLTKAPEELMDYYADDPSLLPQGDVLGRIQWIHQNNGRIRMIGRVLSTRDLFFHFNDVELKDGQSLNVGDRVLFEISVYKNLVCAKHIRKLEHTRSKSSANVPRD